MRFLATKAGTVHVVDRSPSDPGGSSCPIVTRAQKSGEWKGRRSLSPEAALDLKDCVRCESHKLAKAEVRKAKQKAKVEALNKEEVDRFNGKPPARRQRRESPVSKVRKQERNVTTMVKGNVQPVADERTTQKAKEHVALAEEHGWSVTVTSNPRRGLTVIASKGDEICVLAYRENGILWNDEIVFKVPGRTVPMHNSGTWRRQVSLPEGKRPISARPKRFGRKKSSTMLIDSETESENGEVVEEQIPLNKSSLPFPHDAEDIVIIDCIKGKTLYWRNNMLAKVVSAQVPSHGRMIRFGNTGRAQRRYVAFPEAAMTKDGEIYGPERCVAVEDMLRVR